MLEATMLTVVGYTTAGSIRGQCGHLHRTVDHAQFCLDKDQFGCSKQGGYSDRQVVEVGSDGYLYNDLASDDWVASDGGRSCGALRFTKH